MASCPFKLPEDLRLVYWQVKQLRPVLPRELETEDLVSEGTVGMLRAAARFDPDRGSRFVSYAMPAIRGAMLEYVRWWWKQPRGDIDPDWLPVVQSNGALDPGLRRQLFDAIGELDGRQQRLLRLHYWEEIPCCDVGPLLGISAKRASELHARALRKLEASIRKKKAGLHAQICRRREG